MTESWEETDRILQAALDLPAGERAALLDREWRSDEAEAILKEAHESHREGLGEEHARIRHVTANLAEFYEDLGSSEDAAVLRHDD